MKKLLLVLAGLLGVLLVAGACGVAFYAAASGPDPDALPQVAATADSADPAPRMSSCDAAREALLTGSKADIKKALKALVADKTADATAREAAQSYLAETDPDLRDMHASLVQVSCAV